jgi:uncharacterized protein
VDTSEPTLSPAPPSEPASPKSILRRALIAVVVTTAAVTGLSYAVPADYAATAVGLAFLAATWWLVLRGDEGEIASHGLSLGGVLEPRPLSARRLLHNASRAFGWFLVVALLTWPLFWIGYRFYWNAVGDFAWVWPAAPLDEYAGQLLVIALPEEAFFRGYLQSELDRVWRPRFRVLGASVGPGLLVAAAVFAVGHLLTQPHPARLAVFFPALVFGWLRARTGGIGASVLFHAACNLFSATLARGYGL